MLAEIIGIKSVEKGTSRQDGRNRKDEGQSLTKKTKTHIDSHRGGVCAY